MLVAALGHAFGPNAERGVFRTTDGGATWQKVLYKDDKTGAIDCRFDPHNPNVILCRAVASPPLALGVDQRRPGQRPVPLHRRRRHLEAAHRKRTAGGRSRAHRRHRVGRRTRDRVYAIIEAEQGGIYRSDDGGENWTKVNDDARFTQRAWYYGHIFADPKNADTVYMLNDGMFRSTDGGKTWTLLPRAARRPSRPLDRSRQPAAHDQGQRRRRHHFHRQRQDLEHAQQPADGAVLPRATDNRFPYYVYGAQQDNSSVAIASSTDRRRHRSRSDWYAVGGGEAASSSPDPRDPEHRLAGTNEA